VTEVEFFASQALESALRVLSGNCGRCGSSAGVEYEPTRTAYYFEPGEPDPNVGAWLCRPCADEYHEHWDDMWNEWWQR
jgi:hypothetical protein